MGTLLPAGALHEMRNPAWSISTTGRNSWPTCTLGMQFNAPECLAPADAPDHSHLAHARPEPHRKVTGQRILPS